MYANALGCRLVHPMAGAVPCGVDRAMAMQVYVEHLGVGTVAFVKENLERIGHIQIADHPGRHEPGTGTLDFDRLFSTLDAIGYRGWVGCEYVPAGDTRAGLAWRERFRRELHKERTP